MPRRLISAEERAAIENTRIQLAKHFELLKTELTDREAIENKIKEIYAQSTFADKDLNSKYRVYTTGVAASLNRI